MLKGIIAIWKGETFMSGVVERFGEMLSDAEFVFRHAWGVLVGKMVIEEVRQTLYDKDIAINKGEREIRRMLAEHLSINPKQDVSGCLTMMSLIKDAERIGDYSKNIFELGVILEGKVKDMQYIESLTEIQEKLLEHFPLLQRAYHESDENIAKDILQDYPKIKEQCKTLLNDLFSEDLSTREAVSTAILIRSLKRINSHMSNIASGIVYPLDKIDFVQERGGLGE